LSSESPERGSPRPIAPADAVAAAREQITAKVLEIVARYAQVDRPIGLCDRLEDLKIDSLSLMELLFDIEEAFDIEIDLNANDAERQRAQWQDVTSAVATVERLVAGSRSAE
jgi:acyl carrier protein